MSTKTSTAAKSTKTAVRGRKPVTRERVLLDLRGTTVKTRNELGISASYAAHLIEAGFIQKAPTTVPNVDDNGVPQRGRPAHTYKLTKSGRDKARRLAEKLAKADAKAVDNAVTA